MKMERFQHSQGNTFKMDFSDDDVSVSDGSEGDQGLNGVSDEEEDVDFSDVSEEPSDDATEPGAAAAAAGAGPAAAAAVAAAVAPSGARDVTQALISGEMSSQTALLQMELSELLSEVASARNHAKQSVVQAAVSALTTALASLPRTSTSAAAAATNGTGTAAALGAAISSLGPDAQGVSLDVCPPSCVQVVGSWADGSAVNLPGSSVDVAVQIPSSCIHHKDHLNFRYHAKRALYLAQLSQYLAAHPAFSAAQQQATALQGDPYRPALLLHLDTAALSTLLQQQSAQTAARGSNTAAAAGAFGSTGLILRLLPTVGLDCFDLAKLAPSRNNIRWAVPAPAGAIDSSSGKVVPQQQDGQQELPPTPHYNAGVLQDMLLLVSSHKQQQAVHAGGVRFADALVLLKVWAQQHGLSTHGVLHPAAPACYGPQHSQHGQHKQENAGGLLAAAATAVQADGFTGHLLSALLIAAVQRTGETAISMSSLQLFKAALQLVADKQQWVKGAGASLTRDSSVPAALRKQHQQHQQTAAVEGKVSKDHARLLQKLQQQLQSLPAPTDTAAAFRKAYGAVLLDGSGHLNLAAGVSSTQLQLAQAAAQQSLSVLNRQSLDPDVVYAVVFKPGQGLARVFHYTWTVELPDSSGSSSNSGMQQPGDQHAMRLAEAEVEGLVRAALGSRARLVKALRRAPLILSPPAGAAVQQQQQPRKKAKHSHKQQGAASTVPSPAAAGGGLCVPRRIVVGAVVDPVAVLRLVDVGPAADDAAAAGKFRKLWGDKSELRRFQDGKICEAVVWEGVPTGLRHQIPDLAAVHILQRHFPAGTVITSSSTALDPLLYAASNGSDADAEDNMQWAEAAAAAAGGSSSSGSSSSISIGGSSGSAAAEETAASRAADAALDSLTKQLRALSDLALKVIGVQPLSSVTRHTCCFYPEAHPLAEGSGARAYTLGAKVPRVLEAIDVMVQLESTGKMPLHLEAFAKTKAALGVQLASTLSAASGAHVTATEEALEVLWQGFAFKLILYLDRESTVVGAPAVNGNSGSSGQQPLPVLLSQHHGLVSALAGAHAAYAPTVRLAKRWLGAQLLLGGQVCEEAVELLVGAVFQGPSTAPPPASRITGLLGFLHLLASHPWQAAPLLVDPSGEVKQEQKQALQAEYESRREAGAAPAMFIATPYDLHTSRWTSQHPSSLVAAHLVLLARAAWHTLSQLLLLGADAPLSQQQLALLQQEQQQQEPAANRTKRSKQLQDAGLHEPSQGLPHMEGCALGRAWRLLCNPALTGFDALILLRKEALPFADRSDPFAVQQLQLLVAQQHRQQRRLAASQKHQQDGALQQLLGDHGGGSVKCAAPKNARAILRSIPEQVLLSKPADKLRSELLVGFDPVNIYLSLLAQRYGHLAQFCADSSSGFPAIGIKWQPAAFLPGPLRPNLAHAQMEVCVTAAAAAAAGGKSAGKGGKGSNSKGLVVPNVPQVLSEAAEMGLGLVEEVLLL